ncbi:hypothetical protein IJ732_08615 [bacterium]|nr:hypothetical protein [bacterium]
MKIEKNNKIQTPQSNTPTNQTSVNNDKSSDSIFDEAKNNKAPKDQILSKEIENIDSGETKSFRQVTFDMYGVFKTFFTETGEKIQEDANNLLEKFDLNKGIGSSSKGNSFFVFKEEEKNIHKSYPETHNETNDRIVMKKKVNAQNGNMEIDLSNYYKSETKLSDELKKTININLDNESTWNKNISIVPNNIEKSNINKIIVPNLSNIDYYVKLSGENKYDYKPSDDGITHSVSFKTEEEFTNKKITSSTGISTKISLPDVLITDKDENKKGSISNSFSAGLTYDTLNNYTNDFKQSLNLKNGISTSLTYQPHSQVKINLSGNGYYTLSTAEDSYGISGNTFLSIQPVKKDKNFKLHFGAGYSQSDYVKPKNNKNLEKKISLNTNVDFNSNISAIAEYDIHLDENKPNSFGVGLRFH